MAWTRCARASSASSQTADTSPRFTGLHNLPGLVTGEVLTVLSLLVFGISVYRELMRPRAA